ncbi:lysylphosphatidylglycerol synthase domain-containing protein [Wenzhouxiangella sp. 15181]|uniref:lysylphosphatidylglycerol synthase domain-containing protein n=2 Tax=unclassified Wenzhouxiangella TaxID=2613841 RepID=UPI001C6E4484|nr:lysylphosphatidylglycerol synthase domain-containing protein [Wenzhouxiangella sp. 15181]
MIPTPWKIALTFVFTAATIFLAVRSGAFGMLEAAFTRITWVELSALFAIFVVIRIIQAYSLIQSLKVVNTALTLRTSLELAALKGFYNLGLGGAGFIAQAIHVRSRNLFSITQLAWATATQSILLIAALGAFLLAVAPALFDHAKAFWAVILLGGLGTLIPFMALPALRYSRRLTNRLPVRLQSKLKELQYHFPAPRMNQLVPLWLLQVSLVGLRLGRIIFIAVLLDPLTPIGELAATTLFADLATVVPLTPGGIGIREFLIGAGGSLGRQPDLFIIAAIIDRGIAITGNLVHGTVTLTANHFNRIN